MQNSKTLGNRIATARKKANLSQADLAQQVSISPQAVGKWERGESMPDITTLNRLAEILSVDLNYFSESFHDINGESLISEPIEKKSVQSPPSTVGKKPTWDMSKTNLVESDFSGLKNLHEKLSSSNLQKCLFIDSDMSGLLLDKNNIDKCDFSNSNISNSSIQNSMINKSIFKYCSLNETEFSKTFLNECNFSEADLTNTIFKSGFFTRNEMENARLKGTIFFEMGIQDIVFEGTIEDCSFENCALHNIIFKNVTLLSTFFKNNKKFKRVQFIDCMVDKLTYAFLKSQQADLTRVTLLS